MRRIKTEGAVAQRRRDGGGFTLEARGAQAGQTFVIVELCDEALEGAPEGHQVGRGVRAGVVGDEAGIARRDACDLAGAEIDQEIELRVRVSEGRGDEAAGLGTWIRSWRSSSSVMREKPTAMTSRRFTSSAVTGRRRQRIRRMICQSAFMGRSIRTVRAP
jgi:hypothetical protein